jgi:hypothetical protein
LLSPIIKNRWLQKVFSIDYNPPNKLVLVPGVNSLLSVIRFDTCKKNRTNSTTHPQNSYSPLLFGTANPKKRKLELEPVATLLKVNIYGIILLRPLYISSIYRFNWGMVGIQAPSDPWHVPMTGHCQAFWPGWYMSSCQLVLYSPPPHPQPSFSHIKLGRVNFSHTFLALFFSCSWRTIRYISSYSL